MKLANPWIACHTVLFMWLNATHVCFPVGPDHSISPLGVGPFDIVRLTRTNVVFELSDNQLCSESRGFANLSSYVTNIDSQIIFLKF